MATASEESTQPITERIVAVIRSIVDPELVMLFGSRATGSAREDSDYDLFVVTAEDDENGRIGGRIRSALSDHRISSDVIVHSEAQYLRHQRDPGLLDFQVAREGVVLYTSGRVAQRSDVPRYVSEEAPHEGLDLWIRRAEGDISIAESSLTTAQPTWDAIAFHAHACAEKYLKALMVKAGSFPPRTHDLKDLLGADAVKPLLDEPLVAACTTLMHVLPFSRYPELPEPTPDEAREAVAAARIVRAAARPRLGLTAD